MTELSTIKHNLYIEGCPIIISSGSIFKNDDDENVEEHKVFANLVFKSISTKPIVSITIDLHIFDKVNNKIEYISDYVYDTTTFHRNEEFGSDINIELGSIQSLTLSVTIKSVDFGEKDIWQGTNTILFEFIPDRISIEEQLDEEAMIIQYKRDFKENFAKKENIESLYVPVEFKDLWFCSCGEINKLSENECFTCGAEFGPQKEHIYNPLQIGENIITYKKMLEEKAIVEKLEAERIAKEAEELRIMAQRQKDYDDMKSELLAKKKKTQNLLRLFLYSPLIILSVIYAYAQINYIIPYENYTEATNLMLCNEFNASIEIFTNLGDYSDSADMINEVIYKQGEYAIENAEYEEAIALFNSIISVKEVDDKLLEANYLLAITYYENNDYETAISMFSEMLEYEESTTLYIESNYNLAKQYAEADDLENTLLYSSVLPDDKLSDVELILYSYGEKLYLDESYEEANVYLDVLQTEDVLNYVYNLYYQNALILIEEEAWDAAENILSDINFYIDSDYLLGKIFFNKAEISFANKDYETAIEQYENATVYSDTADNINECNYQIALLYLDDKNYESAADTFDLLGDYSDSSSQAVKAKYLLGIQLLNNGDYYDSYEILYSIRTYFDAYKVLVETSEFYRLIYDKGLGTNPLYEAGLFKS